MSVKQQKRIDAFFNGIDAGAVQPEELIEALEVLLGILNDEIAKVEEQISSNKSGSDDGIVTLLSELRSVEARTSELVQRTDSAFREEIQNTTNQLSADIDAVASQLHEPFNPDALWEAISRVQGQIPKLPKPDQSIPRLKEGIRDLRKRVRDIEKSIKKLVKGVEGIRMQGNVQYVGTGGTGRAIRAFDLNDYGPLDGSTKTFNIPAVYRIISVHSSSSPHAFVENTDYTWTPTSITFTSEVDAGSTLAAGQTITVIYAEA